MSGTESHKDREEDHGFLHSMLMEKKLHLLFKIHERLKRFEKRNPVPVQEHAASLASDLVEELIHEGRRAEVKELVALFSTPHFKSLLFVHDSVAQGDFEPTLPQIPNGVLEEEEDSVKIVSLVKTKEPLGATIKRDESTGAIVVARIMRGGAADKSGLIHEGDELKEVNGVSLECKKPSEVLPLLEDPAHGAKKCSLHLKNLEDTSGVSSLAPRNHCIFRESTACSQSEVTFKIIPAFTKEVSSTNKKKLFVRTLFDYDPTEDPTVPCKHAAMAFKKGDVLQIVSTDDDTWWQACHHGDSITRAGLIPSQQLHERRVALQRPKSLFKSSRVNLAVMEDVDYGAITGIHIGETFDLLPYTGKAGLRRSFRLGRKGSRAGEAVRSRRWRAGVNGSVRTPSYMEVIPYCRDPKDRYRLVLLVGPSGVGVNELKRRLLISDPDRYGVTVPHTTREKRRQENDGVDYRFVSMQMFEEDILSHRFLEYGRHRGHYYGISLDSVLQVIAEGKVCILDAHPSKIKHVYTFEFKPYVVFVKPPRIEELRLTRRRAKFICDGEEKNPVRTFSEEDFEDMIDSAETMESQYGHLFDKVIVNGDIVVALRELKANLEKIEGTDVQWIPAEWICSSPTKTQRSSGPFSSWI